MADVRIIEVECQCVQELVRYKEVKRGTLQKMYLGMTLEDRVGIFNRNFKLAEIYFTKL